MRGDIIRETTIRLGLRGLLKTGGKRWKTKEIKALQSAITRINEKYRNRVAREDMPTNKSLREEIIRVLEEQGPQLWPSIEKDRRWLYKASDGRPEYTIDLVYTRHQLLIEPYFVQLLIIKCQVHARNLWTHHGISFQSTREGIDKKGFIVKLKISAERLHGWAVDNSVPLKETSNISNQSRKRLKRVHHHTGTPNSEDVFQDAEDAIKSEVAEPILHKVCPGTGVPQYPENVVMQGQIWSESRLQQRLAKTSLILALKSDNGTSKKFVRPPFEACESAEECCDLLMGELGQLMLEKDMMEAERLLIVVYQTRQGHAKEKMFDLDIPTNELAGEGWTWVIEGMTELEFTGAEKFQLSVTIPK